MKKILILAILLISFSSLSKENRVFDTISNWQVYNSGILLKAFNSLSLDNQILLKKVRIKAIDTLTVSYFDDTPCIDCKPKLLIKTNKNENIKQIIGSADKNHFAVRTTELQVLALKNKSSYLRFFYKEDDNMEETLLFELKIR